MQVTGLCQTVTKACSCLQSEFSHWNTNCGWPRATCDRGKIEKQHVINLHVMPYLREWHITCIFSIRRLTRSSFDVSLLQCSSTCDAGNQMRRIICEDRHSGPVAESKCSVATRPPEQQSCNSGPCPQWNYGDWGQVGIVWFHFNDVPHSCISDDEQYSVNRYEWISRQFNWRATNIFQRRIFHSFIRSSVGPTATRSLSFPQMRSRLSHNIITVIVIIYVNYFNFYLHSVLVQLSMMGEHRWGVMKYRLFYTVFVLRREKHHQMRVSK